MEIMLMMKMKMRMINPFNNMMKILLIMKLMKMKIKVMRMINKFKMGNLPQKIIIVMWNPLQSIN